MENLCRCNYADRNGINTSISKNKKELKNDLQFNKFYYNTRLPLKFKNFDINDFKIFGSSLTKEFNQKCLNYIKDFEKDLFKNVILLGKSLVFTGLNRTGKTILATGLSNKIVEMFYFLNNDYNYYKGTINKFIRDIDLDKDFEYNFKDLDFKFYISTEILNLYRPTFKEQFTKKEEIYNCQALFIESIEQILNSTDFMKEQIIYELLKYRNLHNKFTIITSSIKEEELTVKLKDSVGNVLKEDFIFIELQDIAYKHENKCVVQRVTYPDTLKRD